MIFFNTIFESAIRNAGVGQTMQEISKEGTISCEYTKCLIDNPCINKDDLESIKYFIDLLDEDYKALLMLYLSNIMPNTSHTNRYQLHHSKLMGFVAYAGEGSDYILLNNNKDIIDFSTLNQVITLDNKYANQDLQNYKLKTLFQ